VRRPTHVRKRDGRVVPFDEGRIADAIYRAALSAGGEDRFLAEELASLVTLFLSKVLGAAAGGAGAAGPALPGMEGSDPPPPEPGVPSIEQIQDVVERVLVETGHARTAKAYILHRERRSRLRAVAEARVAEGPPTLFDDRFLVVEDPAAESAAPFSAERLARTVGAEAGLDRDAALELVRGVEARLRRSRVRRIPSPVLGALVDAELLETGRLAEPRRRSGALVPRAVIERALSPGSRPGAAIPPETAARRVGGEVLRAHALAESFPESVASAHLDGTIHVHGLARPGALHALTLSLDALKVEGIPGAGGRAPGRASVDARRFLAQAGRAARTLRAYATHGVGVPLANLLLAPLLSGDPGDPVHRDRVREDAWHLLFEASGDPDGVPLEIDLALEVPPALAAAPARGAGGRRDGSSLGDHGPRALALAREVLLARAAGEGLPPRGLVPAVNVVVGRASLQDPRSREVLLEALSAAARGTPVGVVLEREGAPTAGVSLVRDRVADPGLLGDPAALRPFSCQRVTLNLPRAAFRVPAGDLDGFLRECDRAVDLAVEAHRARRSLLATLAAGERGGLAPLFRRARAGGEGPAPLDFAAGTWSVGVLGLNEAVAWLLGEELHEGDAAVKVGTRVLAYLALRVREAGQRADLAAALDASASGRAAARFRDLDRREHRAEQERAAPGGAAYTEGASFRAGAPVDLLRRLEGEGRLQGHLRTAVFRFDPAAAPGVSDEGLLALLEKAFLHTAIGQVALGARA